MTEVTTTIAVIPPHGVQSHVMPLLHRFMPELIGGYYGHITVLAPFAPMHELERACSQLRQVLANVKPFNVSLAGYDTFPLVAYMPVINPEPLCEVYERIRHAFPQYPPYNGKFGDQYKPHITIAHLENGSGQLPDDLPPYEPMTFHVDRIHVQYGVPGTALPWIAYDVIPLTGR
jgi:2'-5' RNA ligase